MMTFAPRGYGGFPSFQFSPPNQIFNPYYNDGYRRQNVYFAPHYPSRPLYQPPFYPVKRHRSNRFDRARQPNIGEQLVMALEEIDEQYRYDQYLRKVEKLQRQYWKLQGSRMPLPMYSAPEPRPLPLSYNPGSLIEYPNPTQYMTYPPVIDPGAGRYGPPLNTGYGLPFNRGYGSGPTVNFGTVHGMNLPPKIRVIFIPPGQSFSQQPCTGPLAMPPFLYNRISQPLCSFALPPPLPQLGSLSLTPAVQQMVVQRYSNPVAVFPFASNWQTPQLMMPGFSQALQQQQQQQLMPACQPFPSASQSYIPPPMPSFPSLPPAPQAYNSPPSVSVPPVMPIFSSFPPTPQSYIPPPTMPADLSVLQPPSLPLPLPYANAVLPSSQYPNSSYPNMCRACPPAPPPLNMLVNGHCWVQHCAACHNVPTPISNPNVRPSSGRITPLLRHPTVPQYVPDQIQQQQDSHANAPAMIRPWLRKTPPLPPGCVVVSDKYFNKDGSRSRDQSRSTTSTSRSTSTRSITTSKTSKSLSPRRASKNSNNPIPAQPVTSKISLSSSSSSSSSSGLSAEYHKTTMNLSKTNKNPIPQQLATEARNINLQYNYQSQELSSVYNINRYLKSSSEASTLSLNRQILHDHSPSFIKGNSQIVSSGSELSSIEEESSSHKEDEKPPPRPPSHSRKPKEKLIIIREVIAKSPSTISTISSNTAFSIIDKDIDSISSTSTIRANKLQGADDLRPKMF